MPLLNPPNALPTAMQAIIDALRAQPSQRLQRERLELAVAPSGIGEREGGGPSAFTSTLNLAQATAIVFEEAHEVVLSPAFSKSLGRLPSFEQKAHSVRRAFIAAIPDNFLRSNAGAADFLRAAAWFLMQEPLDIPAAWPEIQRRQEGQLARDDGVFSNAARWVPFRRWAPYLGLSVHDSWTRTDVLVPDPTAAIGYELQALLASHRGERALPSVLSDLAQRCPVIDGGQYSAAVAGLLRSPFNVVSSSALSRSLSLSLLRLRDWGLIRLRNRADAPKVLISVGVRETEAYSHVEWIAR